LQEVAHFLRELNSIRIAAAVRSQGLLLHEELHFSQGQLQKHAVL
jgi:hypothetical protein